jgi:hypothetical protein
MSRSILLFVILFIFIQGIILEETIAGAPHTAYGKVFNSDSSVPADDEITFISYIIYRSGEVLTETSTGCGYSDGYWSVAVNNFPSEWSVGEILRTEVTNIVNGETGAVEVAMTDAGSDQAEDLYLEPIVPVELSSFNVFNQNGDIVLKWSTESETNNFGFEIQRKAAGENFKRAGFVSGNGTTLSLHHYNYIDTDLQEGTYYYRLKQLDNDGAFEFSEIKSVVLIALSDYNLDQNYPNPFNSQTIIHYQINQGAGAYQIKFFIYNSLGELVRTLVNERQASGTYSVAWDGRDNFGNMVSSGIYIGRLIAKNHISNLKMIYMK